MGLCGNMQVAAALTTGLSEHDCQNIHGTFNLQQQKIDKTTVVGTTEN